MEHAHRGDAALKASNFLEAVEHYDKAIAESPDAPTYYIKRSQAFQRSSQFSSALLDSEAAVRLATKRGKRELIAEAQLRRGIALFNLGQYADAEFVLKLARNMDESEKNIHMWLAQAQMKLAKRIIDDENAKKVTVKENPDERVPSISEQLTSTSADTAPAPAPSLTPQAKIKHEWYQNKDNVYLSVFIKGASQTYVNFSKRSLYISFTTTTGSVQMFTVEVLFAPIDKNKSSFTTMKTKIELTLKKAQPGQKWPSLEAMEDSGVPASNTQSTVTKDSTEGPRYPTSSRSGPKDWDKIAQSFTKPSNAAYKDRSLENTGDIEEATGKDGNDDKIYVDEYDEGDEVTNFFKRLYADANPETQRAMMKSYQESSGTSLSTNWEEVKDHKIPVEPPRGMEEKKM